MIGRAGYYRCEPGILYDTEMVPEGPLDGKVVHLFCRPIGQVFEWASCLPKTYRQTNMVMAAILPCPNMMDWVGFRMGMDETRPYLDRLRLYCRAVVEITVGHRHIWIGPMSAVPCGSMLEFPERDEKEFVFEDKDLPPLVNLTIDGKPWRIKSQEVFMVRILFPDACGLEEGEPALALGGMVPVAFYFYGYHYRALG